VSYIIALDQGTTSSRALVIDRSGAVRGVAQAEFRQSYPKPGWVEHDPEEIWQSQRDMLAEVMNQLALTSKDIAAIGITNQRETTVVWERATGRPIYPAIVWQDRRTAARCDELRQSGRAAEIQARTGLVLDAYFSGTKLQWILEHVPGARSLAERGELACGTIDTWLIWKLTAGQLHVTDPSNASRTLLYNLASGSWDDDILQWLNIPRCMLPTIRSSSETLGHTSAEILGSRIPIAGLAGDQQAALFGQNCHRHGMAKNTYGTGCFMLMNVGETPAISRNQLLSTVAWQLGPSKPTVFALEGSVFIAGATVQWLRDGLGIIRSSGEIEALARSVEHTDGVFLVPAFAGLGAPHWDPYARGAIVGLTRGTHRGHLARAALEGIAYQVADVLEAMESDSEIGIAELRVDGGAAANNLLMQFQADILQVPVVRPQIIETTAIGAGFLAGLAVGYWEDTAELQSLWKAERTFEPMIDRGRAMELRDGWRRALERARHWAQEEK
jgi:glycerol kinase